MKSLFIVLLFCLSLSSFAGITIVSDLDDTIKITQASGNPADYLKDNVYTGMPEFLRAARDYTGSLYILSASPSFLRPKIALNLQKRKIHYKGLILRKNLLENKFQYKVRAIKKLMNASSDDFIFIGDDLGQDPEVYNEIKRLYPARVLDVYVHVVKGRAWLQDTVAYWTSFDLFLREFEKGRMTPGWIEMIFDKLMAETKLEFIFPKKANCPTVDSVWEWQTRTIFMPEARELIERFTSFCQARQSDIILL